MKTLSKNLKNHATKIVSYGKKDMRLLTNKENKSYPKQKVCHICKKEFSTDNKEKNAIKAEITVITPENIEALLIIFVF